MPQCDPRRRPVRTLILVKHAAPEIVPSVAANRWHLSDEGRRMSEALASALIAYQPDCVATSAEPKALETGRIIAHQLGLPIETVDGLHEHERRSVGYLSRLEIQLSMARLFAEPDQRVFGEETADEACDRFMEAIQRVLAQHCRMNVVVVAHGTVISLAVSHWTGTDAYSLWQRLGFASFVVVSHPDFALLKVVERTPDG